MDAPDCHGGGLAWQRAGCVASDIHAPTNAAAGGRQQGSDGNNTNEIPTRYQRNTNDILPGQTSQSIADPVGSLSTKPGDEEICDGWDNDQEGLIDENTGGYLCDLGGSDGQGEWESSQGKGQGEWRKGLMA